MRFPAAWRIHSMKALASVTSGGQWPSGMGSLLAVDAVVGGDEEFGLDEIEQLQQAC